MEEKERKIKEVLSKCERLCPNVGDQWSPYSIVAMRLPESEDAARTLYLEKKRRPLRRYDDYFVLVVFGEEHVLSQRTLANANRFHIELFFRLLSLGVQSPDEKDAEIADLKAANDALQGVHEGDLKALEALRELKSLAPIAGKDHKIAGLEQEIANLNAQRTRLCALISMDSEKTSKLIEALEEIVYTYNNCGDLKNLTGVNHIGAVAKQSLAAYKGKEGETT